MIIENRNVRLVRIFFPDFICRSKFLPSKDAPNCRWDLELNGRALVASIQNYSLMTNKKYIHLGFFFQFECYTDDSSIYTYSIILDFAYFCKYIPFKSYMFFFSFFFCNIEPVVLMIYLFFS